MSAQVLALRPPRRPSSNPHARLLDLEVEVAELLAQGRRVGARLRELEAERAELEKLAATVAAEQERLAQVQQQIAAARERKIPKEER